jgi:hypothetical protein
MGGFENDGVVSSSQGALVLVSLSEGADHGVSDGSFDATGAGSVAVDGGEFSSAARFGSGVGLYGHVRGVVTARDGATVFVGKNVSNYTYRGWVDPNWIDAEITGGGTVEVDWSTGDNGYGVPTQRGTVLRGSLTVATANVRIAAVEAGSGPFEIGPATTLTTLPGGGLGVSGEVTNRGVIRVGGPLDVLCGVLSNEGVIDWVTVGEQQSRVAGCPDGPSKLWNRAGGTLTKSGESARTSVFMGGFENDGVVSSSQGALVLVSLSEGADHGVSDGSFDATGAGSVAVDGGEFSSAARFGSGVGLYGHVRGVVTARDGATVFVGKNVSNYTYRGWVDPNWIDAEITGGGTVEVDWSTGDNGYGVPTQRGTVLRGSLTVATANVRIAAVEAGSGPFEIGPATTLTTLPGGGLGVSGEVTNHGVMRLSSTPSVTGTLSNQGRIVFERLDYLGCSASCVLLNDAAGILELPNTDGGFSKNFVVNGGTFINAGLFEFTGYKPGVTVSFGQNVNVISAGKAVAAQLQDPPWLAELSSPDLVERVGEILGAPGLSDLASNAVSSSAADLLNIGAGSCRSVSAGLAVAGAALQACYVTDPSGLTGMALTLTASLQYGAGETSIPELGGSVTFDAGATIAYNAGPNAPLFSVEDLAGLSYCWNGTVALPFGITGSHCWAMEEGVPFDLNQLEVLRPGAHQVYLGAAVTLGSGGVSMGRSQSYTVLVSCSAWFGIVNVPCPLSNRVRPTVTGAPVIGATLSSSTGEWSGVADSYEYQWFACSSPMTCGAISGAEESTYRVSANDLGKSLYVRVTARRGSTAPAANSLATTPVTASP